MRRPAGQKSIVHWFSVDIIPALGQPDSYTHPNNMVTDYVYIAYRGSGRESQVAVPELGRLELA